VITPLDQHPWLTDDERKVLHEWRKTAAFHVVVRILGNAARMVPVRDTTNLNADYELGRRDALDAQILSIYLIGTPPPPKPTTLQPSFGRQQP
jgi:hypothetical protein